EVALGVFMDAAPAGSTEYHALLRREYLQGWAGQIGGFSDASDDRREMAAANAFLARHSVAYRSLSPHVVIRPDSPFYASAEVEVSASVRSAVQSALLRMADPEHPVHHPQQLHGASVATAVAAAAQGGSSGGAQSRPQSPSQPGSRVGSVSAPN